LIKLQNYSGLNFPEGASLSR